MVLPESNVEIAEIPSDMKIAVVLDRSRSMERYAPSVTETLDELQTFASDVDIYLTSSAYRGEPASVAKLADIAPDKIEYIGGQNATKLLGQFIALSGGRSYDALFVLTDGTGFSLGGEPANLPLPDAPVWMVHVDGNFPYGYDDGTLEAIYASGGGVAGSLEEALTRLMISQDSVENPDITSRDVLDGYEWVTFPTEAAIPTDADIITHDGDDPFAALAARRLILSEMYLQRGQIDKIETLDGLHEIAVEQGIVTPYSSMIVLVTKLQQQRLDRLEDQDNRFEREVEEMGETAPAPMEVTGVPEPHEWLLIILGMIILGWYAWQKRIRFQQNNTRFF